VTDFRGLIQCLCDAEVEFVIIGGLAVIAHGHVRTTQDMDICYARSPGNLKRLVAALGPYQPRLRGAPPELPFFWDEATLRNGTNFTLVTSLGEIDLLGEVTGIGNFNDFAVRAVIMNLFERELMVIAREDLLRAKAAAGRAKDLLDLEALRAAIRG
jgi:hypothetical protein